MWQLGIKAPKITINKEAFLQRQRVILQVQLRQAARVFVREAIVKIPVDLGKARGTFLPLGRFLNVSIPISGPNATSAKMDEGADVSNQLLFVFTDTAKEQAFEIHVQLFYFWFNDFFMHNYPKEQLPTPWESIQTGWDAFMKYMKDVAPQRFPKIKEFIKVENSYNA